MAASARPLIASSPATSNASCAGRLATRPKSIDIPTAMKNRPSSRPLNGAMSVSRAWRYSELASSTPARKAPSAIDRPASDISSAMPNTSSSAKAVKISRTPDRAIRRITGRVRKRPIRKTIAIAARPLAAICHPGSPPAALAPRSGTSAISGMAAMSWNSRIANDVRPTGASSRLRSAIVWTAMAVDDMASASPATTAPGHASPRAQRPAASAAPHAAIWSEPPPNTAPRMSTSRLKSSSSPIRNSISTTPNSEKCRIDSTLVTNPRPHGPMAQPAIR